MRQIVEHRGRYQLQDPHAVFRHLFPNEQYVGYSGFRPRVGRVCKVCGAVFLGTHDNVYCSRKCSNKAFIDRRRRAL